MRLAMLDTMQQRDDKKATGVARLWAEVRSLFVTPRVRVVRI